MGSWNDFNDAQSNTNLIPKGTLAKVRLTIRPGGFDDPSQGWTGGYAMRGRLVLNGATEIRGSLGEISATHVTLATAIWLQTMVPLTAGNTVELQGYFRVADGYFAADHTSFWGCKVG